VDKGIRIRDHKEKIPLGPSSSPTQPPTPSLVEAFISIKFSIYDDDEEMITRQPKTTDRLEQKFWFFLYHENERFIPVVFG
jgi:hypothetical protein